MKHINTNLGMKLHRLLLAAVVWLAPLCLNLPCCCTNTASASIEPCTLKPEKKGCCSKETLAVSRQKGCCRKGSDIQSRGLAGRLWPSCCECCPQLFLPESCTRLAEARNPVSITRCYFWLPLSSDQNQSPCTSMETIGQRSCSISSHNRLQSVLCVWRN